MGLLGSIDEVIHAVISSQAEGSQSCKPPDVSGRCIVSRRVLVIERGAQVRAKIVNASKSESLS